MNTEILELETLIEQKLNEVLSAHDFMADLLDAGYIILPVTYLPAPWRDIMAKGPKCKPSKGGKPTPIKKGY
jgi:hypothetical protein